MREKHVSAMVKDVPLEQL